MVVRAGTYQNRLKLEKDMLTKTATTFIFVHIPEWWSIVTIGLLSWIAISLMVIAFVFAHRFDNRNKD